MSRLTKPKRKVDKKLLKRIRTSPCLACGKPGPSDAAHCIPQGRGGHDDITNCFPLCRAHHILQHSLGFVRFADKFPLVKMWIEINHPDLLKNIALKLTKP